MRALAFSNSGLQFRIVLQRARRNFGPVLLVAKTVEDDNPWLVVPDSLSKVSYPTGHNMPTIGCSRTQEIDLGVLGIHPMTQGW
jgi:hypothetical protein